MFKNPIYYCACMVEKFRYTQDPLADEPRMFIDKHIGYDEVDGVGVDGNLFMKELFELDAMGKKKIVVEINSVGGSVLEGMSIYHAILNTKTPVDTYCVGIAASIAGVIFQAGKNRIMADYGILMYHNPYNPNGGQDKGLEAMRQSIITMVGVRSGMTSLDVETMMAKTTFIDAEEALKIGLCDEVKSSGRLNKKRTYERDVKALWREADLVLNKARNEKKEDMKNIANKLGLVAEASEESILKAIDSVLNKNTEEVECMKEKCTEMENALSEKDKECAKLKSECEEMKSKIEETENAAKAKAEAEVDAKAMEKVQDAVKLGKIKNEEAAISKWKALFVADLEGTQQIVDSIQVAPAAPAQRRGFNFKEIENKATDKNKEIEGLKNMGIVYGSMEYHNYMKRQEVSKRK